MILFNAALITHPGKTREKAHRYAEIAFFMAEQNLYDARLILKVKDKIGLTMEQEEKIENIMLAHEAFTIQNGAEIKIKELQFVSYLKSETGPGKVDRKQVETYIREISKVKTDMIVHYMNYLLDLKAILTPVQLEKMAEAREKMKSLRKRRKREDETVKIP
jgi:Spy/CpxP family protein refolding chaperone